MRILVLTNQMPRLPGPGTESRCFCLMRELAKKHAFTVLTTAEGFHEEAARLERLGVSVERLSPGGGEARASAPCVFPDFSRLPVEVRDVGGLRGRMRKRVGELLARGIDIVQVEHSTNGIWLDGMAMRQPKILVFHNICSLFARRTFRTRRGLRARALAFREWLRMRGYERRVSSLYDHLVVLSGNEREELRVLTGRREIEIVPNGVDIRRFSPAAGDPEPGTMIYTGGMFWFPNHEAMIHFTGKILPRIWREIPEARLTIVGPRPPAQLRAAARDARIRIVDDPGDARGGIAAASVCVVPLLVGAGTRVKILEAIAMGKPVVSTSIGCEGLGLVNGRDILVADRPRRFAEAVCSLLRDRERARALGRNARKAAEGFDYSLLAARNDALYARIARRG